MDTFIVYNLLTLLVGKIKKWNEEIERIERMGFNWVYLNPFYQMGWSNSIYGICDHKKIDSYFLTPGKKDEFVNFVQKAHRFNLKVMIDLVINHVETGSFLLKEKPHWFKWKEGKVVHPGAWSSDGHWNEWGNLATLNYEGEAKEEIIAYFKEVIDFWLNQGVDGFRCDAAYMVPDFVWQELISYVKKKKEDALFLAETVGASPQRAKEVAATGFDYIYNSVKWWDYREPWAIEQYFLFREVVKTVSFPETHDTPRYFRENGFDVKEQMNRYLFSALWGSGVLLPLGYEFCYERDFSVFTSSLQKEEERLISIENFILKVNQLKKEYPLLNEEGEIEIENLTSWETPVFAFKRWNLAKNQSILIVVNYGRDSQWVLRPPYRLKEIFWEKDNFSDSPESLFLPPKTTRIFKIKS